MLMIMMMMMMMLIVIIVINFILDLFNNIEPKLQTIIFNRINKQQIDGDQFDCGHSAEEKMKRTQCDRTACEVHMHIH